MTGEERVEAIARLIMTVWGWSKPAFDDPIHALTRRNAERVARSIIAADPLTDGYAVLEKECDALRADLTFVLNREEAHQKVIAAWQLAYKNTPS